MSIVILPALSDFAKGGRRLWSMPAPPEAGISLAFLCAFCFSAVFLIFLRHATKHGNQRRRTADFDCAAQTPTSRNRNSEVYRCLEDPRRRPIRIVMDRTLESSGISISAYRSCERLIRMAVPPIPIFPLLFLVGMSIFVIVPVVVRQEYSPSVPLMVVPVVIVLVIPIVNSYLHADFLRHRRGHY